MPSIRYFFKLHLIKQTLFIKPYFIKLKCINCKDILDGSSEQLMKNAVGAKIAQAEIM